MNTAGVKKLAIATIFLSALAAIAYEILAGAALSQLLGASVFYFSITIGLYLFALGVGSWFSKRIESDLFERFIFSQSVLCVIGGALVSLLFGSYVFSQKVIVNFVPFETANHLVFGIWFGKIIFHTFAFSLVFIIGALVGFQLPIFSRIVSRFEEFKDALARVFFWDYFGALIASVAIPIVFLPSIGIFKTSFVIGLINVMALVALVKLQNLFSGRTALSKTVLTAVGLALIFNAAGLFFSDHISKRLEAIFYNGEIVYQADSSYQRIVYVKDGDNQLRLYLNGDLQFIEGEWDGMYHESLVHPAFGIAPRRERILILGGGDGLALREVLKYPDVVSATLVDIDPAMVRSAKELPAIRALNQDSFFDPRVAVVAQDAFKFIESAPSGAYDVIIVDFPDPFDENLSRLYSREFYSELRRALAPDGFAAIQTYGYLTDTQKIILATLAAAGFETVPYHPPVEKIDLASEDLINFGFILASHAPADSSAMRVLAPTRFLNQGNVSLIFSPWPDLALLEAHRVNSLFQPTIFKSQGDIYTTRILAQLDFSRLLIPSAYEKVKEDIERDFYE